MKKMYEIFGASPFIPIMEHMKKVKECVYLLPSFFDKYLEKDYEGAKAVFKDICKKEHDADEIKKDVRDKLPKNFMLPVARPDILNYLKQQDNIADAAEDCGALCMLKNLSLPKELHHLLKELLDKNIKTVEKTAEVSASLSDLTKSGFNKNMSNYVHELIKEVEFMEWECDKLQMGFFKKLFQIEKEIDAISIILWFDIVHEITDLSNASENVGEQMRMMLAKR
jgi:predicted phosphate transport protein (TIGR00153 family)